MSSQSSILARQVLPCCMVLWLCARSVYGADAIPGEEFCDGPLDRIEFIGNQKTRDFVLRRQIDSREGELCSLDDIIDGTQNIMDLRLFKRVIPELSMPHGRRTLTYRVREKIYFLPLPRFSRTSDGEVRFGAQLRWDNFSGLQHRMRITSEIRRQDNGHGREGQVHRFSYDVPRFLGSDYGASMTLSGSQQPTELTRDGVRYGESEQSLQSLGVSFSRWLSPRGTTRGASYHFGVAWQQLDHVIQSGELGPFEEGQDVLLSLGWRNQQIRDDLYRLRGFTYGINLVHASSATGSDYAYNRAELYYIQYLPADSSGLRNFNYRMQVGLSNGGPFGERAFSLGGGDVHRGLKPDAHDGDVLVLLNVEYLIALDSHPTFRWAVFTDVGNVYLRDDIDLRHLRPGAGVGFRWKVLSLLNTDIRVDLAYDNDEQRPRFYFSTDLTF